MECNTVNTNMLSMNTFNMLGKELRRLRKERNLSQEEVAERLHVKRQTYSHYETGRVRPPVKSLCALTVLYGVPMSALLRHMDGVPSEEKDFVLLMQEEELLCYYRKLDEKGRADVLEFVKNEGGGKARCL